MVNLTVDGDQSKGLNAADIGLTGGTVTIHTSGGVVLEASGLGYDPSYCTAVKADNLVLLDGCQLTIVTNGIAGRGISCDGDIRIQAGSLSVTSSGGGGAYTDPTGVQDAYHGPCLNADRNLILSGGTMTLSHSGSAGKGDRGRRQPHHRHGDDHPHAADHDHRRRRSRSAAASTPRRRPSRSTASSPSPAGS